LLAPNRQHVWVTFCVVCCLFWNARLPPTLMLSISPFLGGEDLMEMAVTCVQFARNIMYVGLPGCLFHYSLDRMIIAHSPHTLFIDLCPVAYLYVSCSMQSTPYSTLYTCAHYVHQIIYSNGNEVVFASLVYLIYNNNNNSSGYALS
jgi:hypothetical protein